MIHPLTPDLCDPFSLAEVTVPALYKAAGLEKGELTISYDPTLNKRPLRLKPSNDAVFDKDSATRRVGELIEMIDDAAPPFRVGFLKAHVRRPTAEPWPLDLVNTVTALQLFFLSAQSCRELIGETLQVVASLSIPKGSVGKVCAVVDVYLPGEGKAPPQQTVAIHEYCAAIQTFWNRLASGIVGHWCKDNGISELRLNADILVDPKQAKIAVGGLVDSAGEETAQSVH